ncbi:disease resistance protein RPV1-like [Eucalyptus grandis]|uniref:disease resistance protein RPV1-like n=1 Tax=Eucalyptus grandis TaxID=71139 RepID=UPI00192F0D81|nr:disease resistance protein RPV1-like [Eucalyptus grandis]
MEGSSKERSICKNDGLATSTESSRVPTSSVYDYEVFLSFRGKDTRADFTDFLYTSLVDAGIRVYRDDEELRVGEEIGLELLQAINQSKISIPILSKGYASSVWCLKELVQMVERQKTRGQKIIPIFYDVTPSEVRSQTGDYVEAFLSHEKSKRYNEGTIGEWKAALSVVGAIKGWDLQSSPKRREGELAKTLTREVFNELKKAYLVVSSNLVSVDHTVDQIMEIIDAPTNETRIIGIHGMGGMGKTTIAKIIYNQLSRDFENCCFLRDIRETSKGNGIQCLQSQLISDILKIKSVDIKNIDEGTQTIKDRLFDKRVLLLLDDVEEENHIDALVGKCDWLGKGSKLIITTRNKDVLDIPEVDCSFELKSMDLDQSLQLFSKHAFRKDYPLDEYIDQSKKAVRIAGGLPLALEVIGSLLSHTKKEKWDVILKKLESVPPDKVQSKLKISYDALDDRQKHIFLDISCLFIGYDKDTVVHFWDASKLFPEEAMEVLQNMSLIKIKEDDEVWMHDQLRGLGREIVRRESNMKIGKQSRVWSPDEALDLLMSHEEIKNLKILKLTNCYCLERTPKFSAHTNLERLILRGCSKLVEIDRSISQLKHLVSLDVRYCQKLQRLPDVLGGLEALKELLIDSTPIEEIPNCQGMRNLRILTASHCGIVTLPLSIGDLESLKYLSMEMCKSLERLPDSIGNLELLIKLDISGTRIKELPDSIGKLKNLKIVKMKEISICKIPDALWTIEKLEEIEVTGVPPFYIEHREDERDFHVNIGNYIYKNHSLRILRLRYVKIYAVPRLPESLTTLHLSTLYMDKFPDLSNLTNLKELNLSFGTRDYDEESNGLVEDSIRWWIGKLSKLEFLTLSSNYMTTLPTDISLLPQLKTLDLTCANLRCLSRLPSSLSTLFLFDCMSLCSMDLSNLKKLSMLKIWRSTISEIQGLNCLDNLQDLLLSDLGQVEILPDLSTLIKLRRLHIEFCGNLVEIQGKLPQSLEKLWIYSCESLQKLPDWSSLKVLQMVDINDRTEFNV